MENSQIRQVMNNIEGNIQRCDILKWVLEAKTKGKPIDYSLYYSRGYKDDEIRIGAELVEMYLILKDYIEKP